MNDFCTAPAAVTTSLGQISADLPNGAREDSIIIDSLRDANVEK